MFGPLKVFVKTAGAAQIQRQYCTQKKKNKKD